MIEPRTTRPQDDADERQPDDRFLAIALLTILAIAIATLNLLSGAAH